MHPILPLAALGRRIIVLGPTNSGKSTLAEAICAKTGIPAVHLDQLRHLPNTNWQERGDAEFKLLHDAAVATDAWIMDGGYSKLMALRLARATGIIVLDGHLSVRLRRYLWRSLFQKQRAGGLEGNKDSVRLEMLAWLWKTRNKTHGTRAFALGTGLPHQFCQGTAEMHALYRHWGLERS